MSDQLELHGVKSVREIDGLEMGVLDDGTAFLTGRSLARLCGVAYSTVIERKDEWAKGQRTGKLHRLIASTGFAGQALAVPVAYTGTGVGSEALAYPESVVMAFLEYYAFEVGKAEALNNFRILGRAGFKVFVYKQLGYAVDARVPAEWRQFHDRLRLHALPSGYFSVFREMSDLILTAIQNGLPVDDHTVPDISVGKTWSKHWVDHALDEEHGQRQIHEHNYPDYFPQAKSNPQEMYVYPVAALGDFRTWMDRHYIPQKFPAYLKRKIALGALTASTVELLLAAVTPDDLPSLPPGK